MFSAKKASASAAEFVDGKLQGLAGTIDVVSSGLKNVTQNNDNVYKFAEPATSKMDSLATRLREQNGEELVVAAKKQMLAHPAATVGIAAVAGALIAQAALTAFRAEQDNEPEPETPSLQIEE